MRKKIIALLLTLVFALSMPFAALGADFNTGYIPDPDVIPSNNHYFSTYDLPEAYSLARYASPIEDQGNNPWCVAYGVIAAFEGQMRASGMTVPEGGFSQAYLYARCKQLDGIPGTPGSYIKTAMKIAQTEGLCPDALCPTADYWATGKLPTLTQAMKDAAAQYKIATYERLTDVNGNADIDEVYAAIANNHFVVIGSLVEYSWNTENGGWILNPYGNIRGGHCTAWDGYDSKQTYKGYTGFIDGVNSWGTDWGISGNYEMSYNYAEWRDLSVGMPMILEAYVFDVAGAPPNVSYINMPIPLRVISPGYTVLPFRVLFEALGGTVEWGQLADGRVWVRGTVELKYETITLEMTEGDPQLKVIKK